MSAEQFEQAKREFVEKWNLKYSKEPTTDPHTECLYYPITPHKSECLSDLNSLLEQHKEVMKEELRQKLLSMRSKFKAMSELNDEDKLMQYGYHDCINEMLMWIKPLKP